MSQIEWKYEKAFYADDYIIKHAVKPMGHSKPIARVSNENHARLIAAAPELLDTLKNGKLKSWVHNAALTNDIEALRKICVEWSDWWNYSVLPVLEKAEGAQ